MPVPGHSPRQEGLSLVELMVSITIGMLIVLGIGYLYVGNRQTYRMADNVARMQENGRHAIEILSRDIRMAGYWGCAGMHIAAPVNTLNDAAQYAYRFDRAVEGHEATLGGVWQPALDAGIALAVTPGTDVLTLRRTAGDGITVLQHPGGTPPGSADLKVNAGSGLSKDDIVLVSDCENAAIFQITNLNTASGFDNLAHNTGTGTPGNATQALGKEYVGGEVRRIATVSYFIGSNPAGRPALFRRTPDGVEELVENVEDMQLSYGEDTNGDGAVDGYRKADDVTDWANVRAVRIRLLLTSPQDNLTDSPQSYRFVDSSGDGIPDPVTAPDRRLRYVFTTTVGVRNRLP